MSYKNRSTTTKKRKRYKINHRFNLSFVIVIFGWEPGMKFFFLMWLMNWSTTPSIVIRTKITYFEWLKICKHSWWHSSSGSETHGHGRAGFGCDLRTLMLLCKKPRGRTVSGPNWSKSVCSLEKFLPCQTLELHREFLYAELKNNFFWRGLTKKVIKFLNFNLVK